MKRSFGQTAKAVGGGALLGVFCAIGLGKMAGVYCTPVFFCGALEIGLGEGSVVAMLLFPFALLLGSIAGFQQVKGRPTLRRLLWGLFLGTLISGYLVWAATTKAAVKGGALVGTAAAYDSFDTTYESRVARYESRVARRPWFSRPLVVVGPAFGLLLGLIVPRRLRWGETALKPWRSAFWLVIAGAGLIMPALIIGMGPIFLFALIPVSLLKWSIRTESALEPNPDDSLRVCGSELKAGGTKAAQSELAADPTRIKREADPSRIWKQLFLFLTGCFLLGLAMFLSTRGFGPIILLVLFPAFLLICYMRTKSALEPNPDDSRRVCGSELKAGGTKAAQSPLVAFIVHVSKLLAFALAVLIFLVIGVMLLASFVFGGGPGL